jgi:transcriptional regulator with XRE-family HTH domain
VLILGYGTGGGPGGTAGRTFLGWELGRHPEVGVRKVEMISPYVRRLRLAAELRALRAEGGLTHEQLAKQIGQSRAQISRLENGHVVDQDDVMRILDALGVQDERWTQIMTIAREAGERGWWESNKAMGDRQAFYANLEAGAKAIREFQMTFIPGLLQTPEFTRARGEADRLVGRVSYTADKAAAGRLGRQRMLRRPGGAEYEVILDELAIRRAAAPWEVVKAQLYHIAATVNGCPKITARVLPIDARIEGYIVPRSAFSVYTFRDPDDPKVVAVDTVTDDLVLTDIGEPDDVVRYEELYERIRDASMTMHDSLELLMDVANTPPPPESTAKAKERRARRSAAEPKSTSVPAAAKAASAGASRLAAC